MEYFFETMTEDILTCRASEEACVPVPVPVRNQCPSYMIYFRVTAPNRLLARAKNKYSSQDCSPNFAMRLGRSLDEPQVETARPAKRAG